MTTDVSATPRRHMSDKRIVGVALKMKRGTIYSLSAPGRHGDVIAAMREAGESVGDIAESEQGFVTDGCEFFNRWQSARIAYTAGQIDWRPSMNRELFSEDVW